MREQQLIGQRRLPDTLEQLSLRGHQRLRGSTRLQLRIELQLARRKRLDGVAIQPRQRVPLGEQQLL